MEWRTGHRGIEGPSAEQSGAARKAGNFFTIDRLEGHICNPNPWGPTKMVQDYPGAGVWRADQ